MPSWVIRCDVGVGVKHPLPLGEVVPGVPSGEVTATEGAKDQKAAIFSPELRADKDYNEGLQSVQWKRIAAGLFQPLGVKVVNDQIYVLGRDGVTRLHDLNGDGEADFYENFNNDCALGPSYGEYAMDLQTDREGNFYYAKAAAPPHLFVAAHRDLNEADGEA